MNDAAAKELQATLHHEIPLTEAMGLHVIEVTPTSVTLAAPLEPNINHKSTAFGGSLYTVAVLAGWGLIHTRLRTLELGAKIVIQHGEIDYRKPVTDTLAFTARITDPAAFERFVQVFRRRALARISLTATAGTTGDESVVFVGQYVIHK